MAKTKVLICTKGKSCRKRGSKDVYCALEEEIDILGLAKKIQLKKSDCMGYCGQGPAVQIKPDKVGFGEVSPKNCLDILRWLREKKPHHKLLVL